MNYRRKANHMVELNLNFNELEEMTLDTAQKIIKEFDKDNFLEEIEAEVDGVHYCVKVIEEGDWDDEGKYQFRNDIGVLCECDSDWNIVKMFDIAVTSSMVRSGSYFTEYYYEYEDLEIRKIIKKVIPKQVIPERIVITLEDV